MKITVTKEIKDLLEYAFNEFVRLNAIDDGKCALDDDMPDLCCLYTEDWEDATGISTAPFFYEEDYPTELDIDDSLADLLIRYERGWEKVLAR